MGDGIDAGMSFGFGYVLTTLEEPSLGLGVILVPARLVPAWWGPGHHHPHIHLP